MSRYAGGGGGGVSHPLQLTTGLVVNSFIITNPTLAGECMLLIRKVSILSEQTGNSPWALGKGILPNYILTEERPKKLNGSIQLPLGTIQTPNTSFTITTLKIIVIHLRHVGQLRRAESPDKGAEDDEPDTVEGNGAKESRNASGANTAETEKPWVSKESHCTDNTEHNAKELFKHQGMNPNTM